MSALKDSLELAIKRPVPDQFDSAATAYCNQWNEVRNLAGQVVRRIRPRIHPLVPHPGSGPGAVRMVARLLRKEAVLASQHKARELAGQ